MFKEEKELTARILDEAKDEVIRLKKESVMKSRVLNRLEESHKEMATAIKVKNFLLAVILVNSIFYN